MKNVIQYKTDRLDYENETGNDIGSGQLVPLNDDGTLVMIASGDIADGSKGVLARDIVVTVPKVAAGEIAKGTRFKVGTAGNTVQAVTAGETALVMNAFAYRTAGDGDETAQIVVE